MKPWLPGVCAVLLLAQPVRAEASPPAAAPAFVDAGGVSLRYQMAGRGPTVVLLHEIGMSLEGWDEVAPALARDHRVLRYDLRGFGLSQKIRGTVTLDDEVADLAHLLDALHVDGPVTLVGSALGASVAFGFAARYPARVRGVYAISPVITLPPPPGAAAPAPPPPGPSPTDILLKQGVAAYLAAQENTLYPPASRTPERFARFRGIQMASDPIGRAATVRMVSSADVASLLPGIRIPARLVATTGFALQPPARIRRVAALLPDASVEEVATGHLAPIAAPAVVVSSIRRFLAEIRG